MTADKLRVTADKLRVTALMALVLTAQSPAPSPVPWCATIPLPAANVLPLGFNAGGDLVAKSRTAPCRPLDVHTPRATLHLAVAASENQRERGLMNVPFVPAGQGMLFVFDGSDQRRYFWMKDTIAPLDMIFLDGNGAITSIAANVPATAPGTPDDQIARREGVGRYVIELAAGEAARLGLAQGTRLVVPPVAAR